MSLETFDGVH